MHATRLKPNESALEEAKSGERGNRQKEKRTVAILLVSEAHVPEALIRWNDGLDICPLTSSAGTTMRARFRVAKRGIAQRSRYHPSFTYLAVPRVFLITWRCGLNSRSSGKRGHIAR